MARGRHWDNMGEMGGRWRIVRFTAIGLPSSSGFSRAADWLFCLKIEATLGAGGEKQSEEMCRILHPGE